MAWHRARDYFSEAANYFIIVLSYVLCDGVTALVVWPVQAAVMTDVAVFAPLIFLPHGVRVLAAWFCGWKSLVPLVVGPLLSFLVFVSGPDSPVLAPMILKIALVGALSAVFAFEALRLAGVNLYFGKAEPRDWKWLLLVGALAALLDATGRVLAYGDLIPAGRAWPVFVSTVIGDLFGLVLTMIILMFVFRWLRLAEERG